MLKNQELLKIQQKWNLDPLKDNFEYWNPTTETFPVKIESIVYLMLLAAASYWVKIL